MERIKSLLMGLKVETDEGKNVPWCMISLLHRKAIFMTCKIKIHFWVLGFTHPLDAHVQVCQEMLRIT
jgi:hypothetical protein